MNSLPVQRFPLPTPIPWTNRCPDQPDEYLQTGKRCSTSKFKSERIGLFCREHTVDLGHNGGSLTYCCRDTLRRT